VVDEILKVKKKKSWNVLMLTFLEMIEKLIAKRGCYGILIS
jgi:hypothetical protein